MQTLQFYEIFFYDGGSDRLIVEAQDAGIAAAVYAQRTGSHPYSISCSCCGSHGSARELTEAEVLEAMSDGYPAIILDSEYTADQVRAGENVFYDMRNEGY